MRRGKNVTKFRRSKTKRYFQLIKSRILFKKTNFFEQVQYLHPKDGVYPEKVNPGRQAVNTNSRRIGANPNPVAVRILSWFLILTCLFRCRKVSGYSNYIKVVVMRRSDIIVLNVA